MTHKTLADMRGEIRVSSDDMRRFMLRWFKYDYKIVIAARQKGSGTGRENIPAFTTNVGSMLDWSDEDLTSFIFEMDGGKNIYTQVCPVIKDVKVGEGRGGESNVAAILGTWADIDVKEGSFSSTQEIVDWLHALEAPPSIIVGSGSGGVHAYWRLQDGDWGTKELIERWWAYLDEAAGDRKVDRLIDTARILRIPGTVYFPKAGVKLGAVTLIEDSGPDYAKDRLIDLSADAYRTKIMKRRETAKADAAKRERADSYLTEVIGAGNKWDTMRAIAFMEDFVNHTMTWDEILEPSGWSYIRTQGDNSRVFKRPGYNADERSAVVDFEDSHVMSLFSEAEDTGLSDLREAGVVLTKYRVALRLLFNDDPQLMIDTLVPAMQQSGVF